MNNNNSPIFIGGLFKSGTTLLRAMLGQHSQIASGLETYWFDIDWENIKNINNEGKMTKLMHFYDVNHDTMQRMVEKSYSVKEFIDQLLYGFAVREGKRRWAEKTPGNVVHMDKIIELWPDAQILHIIRDPRDVFASLRQAKKWDTIEEFMDRWCAFIGSAEKHKDLLDLNDKRYLEIRYEKLVINPDDVMEKILCFLNEDFEENVAHFHGKKDDFTKVLEATGKASTTLDRLRKPLSTERIGIWRKILEKSDIDALYSVAKEKKMLDIFYRLEFE